jgi:hypothetical protein
MNYRNCKRIMAIVILLIFSMSPVFGEPPTAHGMNTTGSSMKFYSDTEVTELIEELSEAAEEAIERAAGEAAKAASLAQASSYLASLEREAAAVREALRWQGEYRNVKSAGIKTAVLTGVICFFGGLAVGAGGIAIIQGSR